MSSPPQTRALALVVLGALAIGCGRSPAMPRTAVKLVRVEDGKAVPCNCADDDDDDDDDDVSPRRAPPVQYVQMSEWQEPESARRAASTVVPRGGAGAGYTDFGKLTLHKPIGETRYYGRFRWR